jgi:NADH-quinone oxidoreductase subunit H
MFMLSEFMGVVIQSAIVVTLFFGGPSGPVFGPVWLQNLLPIVWFMAKTVVFIFFFILLRGSQPRARYDKLMALGWKVMIPIALVWAMVTAVIVVAEGQVVGLPDQRIAGVVGLITLVGAMVVMPVIARDARSRRDLQPSTARHLPLADQPVPLTTNIPPSGQQELTQQRRDREVNA